jgi:uncharacterized membrane protein
MTFMVTLFTRKDCSLCDQAEQDLKELQSEVPHKLAIVDIDTDPDLQAVYNELVPVVKAGPYTIQAPFDKDILRWKLMAARDSDDQRTTYEGKSYIKKKERRQNLSRGERISYWISRRYLLVVNLLVFLYVGLPFLAPVLMHVGLPGLAKPIYTVYSATCHQLAFRSWFLFGDQVVYPREAANVEGLDTFGNVTGINENALLDARRFIGDEQIGYKVAFCERDVAIYAAILLFGLLYAASKERIPALPWYLWFLIGWAPIGLDGFSQLLSQLPNWSFWAYRESTPFLRTLTGGLFGFTTAWFGYPLLKETFEETRVLLATKIARLADQNKD